MFLRECRKILFSVAYLLLVGILVAVFASQSPFPKKLEEPQPGQDNYSRYGYSLGGDAHTVMKGALTDLAFELTHNTFTTYPIGFYKEVKLNEQKRKQVAEIAAKCLDGWTAEQLLAEEPMQYNPSASVTYFSAEGEIMPQPGEPVGISIVPADVPYEEFEAAMAEIDDILGGGSKYEAEALPYYDERPFTYEQAMEEYQLLEKEGFAGAYARLFSDYLVIFATLAPVFVAVAEGMRDRQARMRDVIWTRDLSSTKLMFTRYAAIVAMSFLPVLVLAAISCGYVYTLYPGEAINPVPYLQYTFVWILPGMMVSAATGMLLTEATDTPIGILVMGAWWFVSVFAASSLIGNVMTDSWTLIPRHNSLVSAQAFQDAWGSLWRNRGFYVAISIALVGLTAVLTDRKRKGKGFGYERISAHLAHRKG